MDAQILKFPYSSSRRVHSQKPRRSKNGTPEERAAKAAAALTDGEVIRLAPKPERATPEPDTAPDVAPDSELPMVDFSTATANDSVLRDIERHRAAVTAYSLAVEAEYAAEGKVSEREYEALQAVTKQAFDDMMLFARMIVLVTARTRRGLIQQTRYLVSQFNAPGSFENGCTYMPDDVNGKPWPLVFLTRLAKQLRRMGPELEPERKKPKRGGLLAASKAASAEAVPQMGGDEWRKAVDLFCNLEKRGMVRETVKCLQALLAMKPSAGAARVKGRPVSDLAVLSERDFSAKLKRLSETDRCYMDGYTQGLIDSRSLRA